MERRPRPEDRPADPQAPAVARRAVLAAGAAVGALPLLPRAAGAAGLRPARAAAPRAPRDADLYYDVDVTTKVVRPIMFPIIPASGGIDRLRNFGQNRGDHIHAGEDIGCVKLSHLLACVDGVVVQKKFDTAGNYLYLRGDDGWFYGYLHINNDDPGTDDGKNPPQWAFVPGIDIGVRVTKGQHVAYVGDSGDAEDTIPHLHFEIRKPTTNWYHAQALSPTPSLDAAEPARELAAVPPETFVPWDNAPDLVRQQTRDILGREATTGVATWSAKLDDGEVAPDQFIAELLDQTGSADVVAPLVRLYLASFPRIPDAGLLYWVGKVRGGASLDRIADTFANTSEFKGRYGSLSNRDFVAAIYQPMFGRAVDSGGSDYWTAKLDAGTSRGRVVHGLAESSEYRTKSLTQVHVVMVYADMVQRAPDAAGYSYWTGQINAKAVALLTLIKTIRTSSEYAHRIAAGSAAPSTASAPPMAPAPTAPPTTSAPTTTTAPPTTVTVAPAPTSTAPATVGP